MENKVEKQILLMTIPKHILTCIKSLFCWTKFHSYKVRPCPIIQILSWFYPDFIQILFRFYPDFIQILSRFYPDFIQILFRFHPDFIQIF